MAAHLYWRFRVLLNAGDGSFTQFAEVEMRSVAGGADQCVGGTAFFSGATLQAGSAAGAFANDGTASFIQVNGTGNGFCLGYQFAAPVDIVEVVNMGAVGNAARCFREAIIESSDDGITYAEEFYCTNKTWVTGTNVTFTKPAAANSTWWRMRALDAQIATNKTLSIAEIEFHSTIGGAQICSGGTPSAADTTFGAAALALDLNINTMCASGISTDGVNYWAYNFAAAVNVAEIKMTARNDASFYGQAPTQISVESGNDGLCYIRRWYLGSIVWTGAAQVQTLAPAASLGAEVAQLVAIAVTGELPGNPQVAQLTSICVMNGCVNYISLSPAIKLDCWQPCNGYGTYQIVVNYS